MLDNVHSIIVSNVPVNINNSTLQQYLKLHDIEVIIIPFPDEYHHINDIADTKTLQLIVETEEKKAAATALFQSSLKLRELEVFAKAHGEVSLKYAVGSTGQVHNNEIPIKLAHECETGTNPVQTTRRISVTMI